MTVERVAHFFGTTLDEWLTVPPHVVSLPQVRGSLTYGDRCVALTTGTKHLWRGGRRDYDPDLWIRSDAVLPEESS